MTTLTFVILSAVMFVAASALALVMYKKVEG
jgi:hypothetical protein